MKKMFALAAVALPMLVCADYYSPGGGSSGQTQYQAPTYSTPQYNQSQQYQAPQYQTQQQPPAPTYTAPAQTVPQYQGNYGPAPTYYPTYPQGGVYLPPGPVFPGEDAANRIYEENKHPPR